MLIIKKNEQYAVECQTKVAINCIQNGVYFDSEEEAKEWVEDECWIFSGEGWICINCNAHFMQNLKKHRKERRLNGLDDELEVGINTVR